MRGISSKQGRACLTGINHLSQNQSKQASEDILRAVAGVVQLTEKLRYVYGQAAAVLGSEKQVPVVCEPFGNGVYKKLRDNIFLRYTIKELCRQIGFVYVYVQQYVIFTHDRQRVNSVLVEHDHLPRLHDNVVVIDDLFASAGVKIAELYPWVDVGRVGQKARMFAAAKRGHV